MWISTHGNMFYFFLFRMTCDSPVPISCRPVLLPRSKHREITHTVHEKETRLPRRTLYYFSLPPLIPRYTGYRETFAKVPCTKEVLRKISNKKGPHDCAGSALAAGAGTHDDKGRFRNTPACWCAGKGREHYCHTKRIR